MSESKLPPFVKLISEDVKDGRPYVTAIDKENGRRIGRYGRTTDEAYRRVSDAAMGKEHLPLED